MTTKIFFVRHGEVNNPNKICYGRLPGFSLTSQGEKEIIKTSQQLSKNKIAAIYSSPLLRTKQSAKIISNILHLPIHYSDDLLEINSSMEGKPQAYIFSNTINYDVFASKKNNVTGETIKNVAQRMQKFIDETKKTYSEKNIVAVSHGDPIMIVRAIMEGLPLELNSLRPINRGGYIRHGEIYEAKFNS